MTKKKSSTLTLRLNEYEAKQVEQLKKYTYGSTSSGAIMYAVREFPGQKEKIDNLEKEVDELNEQLSDLRINVEAFRVAFLNITQLSKKKKG